jgi:HSP20 family protein
MPQQQATMQVRKDPTRLTLTRPADLLSHIEELSNSIARRAYEIFENNGRTLGHDLEHWFQAESELLRPVQMDTAESKEDVTVRATVPGFKADELEVSLEGNRLTITGKHETEEERKKERTVRQDRILRVIDLPAEVDAGKAVATLKDGLLELRVPKTSQAQSIPIGTKAA